MPERQEARSAARRRLYIAWFVVLVIWPAILCAPLYIPELRS